MLRRDSRNTLPIVVRILTIAFTLHAAAAVADEAPPKLDTTLTEVAYSTHDACKLDFYRAPGDGPRPLLVYIHGGGWVGGDKKQAPKLIQGWLDQGISYAAINYRHTPDHPLPAPVHDAARAIQFLRSKAAEWNIDKNKIVLTGGSAGACTSMWLLCHDDLADPNNDDPVLRESTRVTAAAVAGGQTSIDPPVIQEWLGPNVLTHRMIWAAVGAPSMADAWDHYEQHKPLYVEFSAYNHLGSGDPPLFMSYNGDMTLPSKNAGHGIHHPVYGVKMKEKADAHGVECHLVIPGTSESTYKSANDFIVAKLLGEAPE
jgi:arylformamidase